jgi:hypothetical protein
LQGAFEKIQFDRFLCQQALHPKQLLTKRGLAGIDDWLAVFRLLIQGFQVVAPLVQQASSHPESLRQAHDVVASIHLFYGASTKLLAVALPSLSVHFADLLCKV